MSKRLKEVDYEFWGTYITLPYPTCHMAIRTLHTTNRTVKKNIFLTTNANRIKTYLFAQKYLLSIYNGPYVPGIALHPRDKISPWCLQFGITLAGEHLGNHLGNLRHHSLTHDLQYCSKHKLLPGKITHVGEASNLPECSIPPWDSAFYGLLQLDQKKSNFGRCHN